MVRPERPPVGVAPVTRPTGAYRDDPLLSLEDPQATRRAILTLARRLWSATLMAHRAPAGVELLHRMRSPRSGDYVAEHGAAVRATAGWDPDDWYHGLGVLIEARRERDVPGVEDQNGWEVFYVQYGPAADDVCRWENAEMIAVPLAGVDWPDTWTLGPRKRTVP